jgi:hypothetical protein
MKTKFYNISVDTDIVDVYSINYSKNRQSINSANWSNWESENIVNNYYSFTPTELATPRLLHSKRTPITDIIKIEGFPRRGCVVSSKFLNLLKDFSLPTVMTYPIEVLYNDEIHMYHYILFVHDSTIDIDYEKTKFHVHKYGKTEPEGLISFDAWAYAYENEEPYYVSKLSKESVIYFTKFDYDIFTLERIYSNSVIVNEKLKIVLEKELFGIVFDECKNYHN